MIFKKEKNPELSKMHTKKTMATLRLEKDIQSYQEEKIDFVKLVFPQEQTLQVINVEIKPNDPSPYKQCLVAFQLTFPDTYPIDAPKLKCLNRLYHPNINYQGAVCLPLVRQDYNPTVNLTMIICGLIFIMTYPNGQDPLNPNIGDLMTKNPEMYKKIVEYTIQGRTFQNKVYDKIRFK